MLDYLVEKLKVARVRPVLAEWPSLQCWEVVSGRDWYEGGEDRGNRGE